MMKDINIKHETFLDYFIFVILISYHLTYLKKNVNVYEMIEVSNVK